MTHTKCDVFILCTLTVSRDIWWIGIIRIQLWISMVHIPSYCLIDFGLAAWCPGWIVELNHPPSRSLVCRYPQEENSCLWDPLRLSDAHGLGSKQLPGVKAEKIQCPGTQRIWDDLSKLYRHQPNSPHVMIDSDKSLQISGSIQVEKICPLQNVRFFVCHIETWWDPIWVADYHVSSQLTRSVLIGGWQTWMGRFQDLSLCGKDSSCDFNFTILLHHSWGVSPWGLHYKW